jgi:Ca2+:H+ antiporter
VAAKTFSAARKNRVDLAVGVAMGSSAQIALFVAPVLLILSYFVAPAPMDLNFGAGQVLLVLLTTLTVAFVTSSGRSAWYTGVQLLARLRHLRVDAVPSSDMKVPGECEGSVIGCQRV